MNTGLSPCQKLHSRVSNFKFQYHLEVIEQYMTLKQSIRLFCRNQLVKDTEKGLLPSTPL